MLTIGSAESVLDCFSHLFFSPQTLFKAKYYMGGSKMGWTQKAEKMIAEASLESWKRANLRNGKRLKTHHPYSLPQWVIELVECLKHRSEFEYEEKAKRIMMYPFLRDY
jgi:hypothetical protein